MLQNIELILLCLSDIRNSGSVSSERQLKLIQIDMNPSYVIRECIMFLDEESEADNVPTGASHLVDLANKILLKCKGE